MPKKSEVEGWAGFDPSRIPGALYPSEVITSDFPFQIIHSCLHIDDIYQVMTL